MKTLAAILLTLAAAPPLSAMKGSVFTNDGEPVAGATIEVFRTRPAEATIQTEAPLATTKTSTAGAFSLDAKTDAAVFIAVNAPGYAPVRMMVSASSEDIVIPLSHAATKSGSVRSPKGPLAGAKVFAVAPPGDILAMYQTDERGRFSMPDQQRWASGVCVVHPDYAETCHWVTEMQAQSVSLDFNVESGSFIKGHVVNSAGKPVAHARVLAGSFTAVTTDDEGFFAVHAGRDLKMLRAIAGDLIGGAAANASDVTISLAPGRVITGTARDESGHSLAGSRVMVQEEDRFVTAIVNAKGEYRVAPLSASNVSIDLQAPDEFEIEARTADLRTRTTARVDLTVKRAAFMRGVVRDEQKRPVAGATVMQLIENMPIVYAGGTFYFHTVTGPDGMFRLPSGSPGGRLLALKPAFAAGVSEELNAVSQKPIAIVLPLGIRVTGIVVDNENKPVAGAAIIVANGDSTLGAMPMTSSLSSGAAEEWMRTDEKGTFTVRLNRGIHDFGIWKRGYAGRDIGGIEISDSPKPIRVVLDRGVEISGRVVHKGGKPADSGTVYAIAQMAQSTTGEVAKDGSFSIGSLSPGTYTLRYGNEQRALGTTVVTAPAANVVIELPETVDLCGRVIDKASGSPIREFEVSATGSEGLFDHANVNDPEGRFVQHATPGEVEIWIEAPGYARATRSVVISEKKAPELVEIALAKGRKITGRVTSSDGHGLAEVRVSAQEDSSANATTDDEGEFQIDQVPSEELNLEFHKNAFVTARRIISSGSADQRVEVTLSGGRRVAGHVVDKSGAPVENAQVNASSQAHGAGAQSAQTDRAGAFTIEGLSDAPYTFTAEKQGLGQAKQIDVDATKSPALVLTLGTEAIGTIHGTVAGAANGGWMSGMVHATSSHGSASAQVGRDGKFVIEDVPAGEVSVRGVLRSMQRQSSTKAVNVIVPAGGDVEVQLLPTGDATVSGIVTAAGEPLAGATVSFSAGGGGDGYWSVVTAANGSYELSGLGPARYNVVVSGVNMSGYSTSLDVSGSTTFDINIQYVQIQGRVLDDRGAPIEAAKVTAHAAAKERSDSEATTDATGGFSLAVQGDSAYRVSAVKKGYALSSAEIAAGSMGPVLLTLLRGEGARVRLIDSRNGAILTGYVVVRDEASKMQIPVSGDRQPDGSLLLPLPEGTYRVSASANEYTSNTVRLTLPSAEVSIPLTRGGTLVVQSRDSANELIKLVMPNGEEYVRCYCNGIAEIRLTGAVTRVDHVAPGAYRMEVVDSRDVVKRTYPVTIAEGQATTVDATK